MTLMPNTLMGYPGGSVLSQHKRRRRVDRLEVRVSNRPFPPLSRPLFDERHQLNRDRESRFPSQTVVVVNATAGDGDRAQYETSDVFDAFRRAQDGSSCAQSRPIPPDK